MVSTSKILTVSYGTFSCTLEGFDDSFDTMKAIAEYFRDLSAGDRYFGAEPATPDAEMLARIAEREISRHVEARDSDGKIHLRAGPASLPAMAALSPNTPPQTRTSSDHAAPVPQPSADVSSADMSPSETPAASSAAAPARAAAEPYPDRPAARATQSNSESIADKLRRIRAVAGPSGAAFSGSDYDEDEQIQIFDADPAEDLRQSQPDDAEDIAAVAPTFQPAGDDEGPVAASAEAADAPGAETQQEQDETVKAPAGAQDATPQEAASVQITTAQMEADLSEIVAPDSETIPTPSTDTDALSDDDILSRLRSSVADTSDQSADSADDLIAAKPDDLDEDDTDALDHLFDDSAPDDEIMANDASSDEGEGDVTLEQLLADTLHGGEMTQEETDAATLTEAGQTEAQPAAVTEACDDTDGEPQDTDLHPLAARVFKIKRADLDAALAGGDLEEDMAETADDGGLSPEAEADLQRELAEVAAELGQSRMSETPVSTATDIPVPQSRDSDVTPAETVEDADWADADDDEELQAAPLSASGAKPDGEDIRNERHRDQSAPDAQASRIFDEADTQLGEPESNKRRSAIQHLRAAVAATKAERRADGTMSPGVDDQPYRKDLQNAVRPRRPQAVTSATPRPGMGSTGRPAPLKLVAEQRIDTPAPAAPIQPRRITRADLAPARPAAPASQTADRPGIASDFAGYAERMGANSLTDLLEAAAAYMADVEGTPQFSRPMLMQKLREAHEDTFSREDGLRSFGQLLRQGKLQKLKGGRFAVTDVTDFRQTA